MRGVLIIVVAAALLWPAAASATFKGTEGKIAYLSDVDTGPLWLWDPITPDQPLAIEPFTFDHQTRVTTPGPNSTQIGFLGLPAPPVWSPDGTRFAYSKLIGDLGNIDGYQHTAIFVYDVRDGSRTQITTPNEALWDTAPGDPPVVGHIVGDWGPMWSGDGTQIAFIRHVQVHGEDDTLYGQRGQNVWKVPAGGGAETQVTHVDQEAGQSVDGGVWIPGTSDLIVSYRPGNAPPFLGRVSSAGGPPARVAGGTFADAIFDYDVSPDGKKLSYAQLGGGGITPYVLPLDGSGPAVATESGFANVLRWSGSGDGLLHDDCNSFNVCGLVKHVLDDPERDVRPDAPERLVLPFEETVGGAASVPARSAIDIQPQTLPVIYVPGFLGSRIECSGSTLWPGLPLGLPNALGMRLAPDGMTNEGCAGAKPGAVIDTILAKDIYDTIGKYVMQTLEPGRGTLFGWDWRKKPEPSLSKLDEAIEEALARDGPWKDQGVKRVVLMGHSYGGLLIRSYLENHPEKVARALSVGSPYWGAPKSLMPLAFGIETPVDEIGMDWFFKNTELRELAKNLSGLYQLFPSAKYTPGWLQVDGLAWNLGGFTAELGGSTSLLAEAQALHASIYDRFDTDSGRVDVHAVVGTGKPTFGTLHFRHLEGGQARFEVTWVNGDGTVPGISGTQGPIGPWPAAPADQIPIQNTCGVEHVALANHSSVIDAYDDWVRYGGTPRKLSGRCDVAGGSFEFPPRTLGPTDPPERARRAGAVSLRDAESAGLVDVVDFPDRALLVTDDHRPVTFSLTVTGATFTYRPLSEAGAGAPLTYGPATGTLELGPPTTPGGAPAVTLDGVALVPAAAPEQPAGPGPGPGPAEHTPTPTPTPTAAPPSNRFSIVGKPARRGRRVALTVRLPGRGRVVVKATAKGKAAGKAAKRAAAAGKLKVRLRLRRGVRGKVRLAVTFTPAGGTSRTLTVKL